MAQRKKRSFNVWPWLIIIIALLLIILFAQSALRDFEEEAPVGPAGEVGDEEVEPEVDPDEFPPPPPPPE